MESNKTCRILRADEVPLELAIPVPPEKPEPAGLVIAEEFPKVLCQFCGQEREDSLTFSHSVKHGEKRVRLKASICWDCLMEALIGGIGYARLRTIGNWKRRTPLQEQE